jgi:ABC-2 type transport system permease protein
MSARGTLRFAGALLATNLKATFALRGAFWLQAAFMAANNVVFFSVWWIFFRRFDDVGGWRLPEMAALYGTVALSFGLSVILAAGATQLARTIADGDLDPYLVQPKPLLLHVVASRSSASGWGDVVSGATLVALSGYLRWDTLPLLLLSMASGAVVFTAMAVLFHSAAFWLGSVHDVARQAWELVITFSVYPQTIHGSFVRVVLFTLIPAGFVGFLPVELLREFTWARALAVLGGALGYGALAVFVFRRGLARYESGSRFGIRA